MFLSAYAPELDEKGRLILPARFRETLEGGLVVICTREQTLAVYPRDTFEVLITPVSVTSSTLKQVRDYQRMLTAGANFEVPDQQGRITIPPILHSYAGLERDVVVVGAISRTRIQDAEYWAEYQAEQEPGFTELNMELLSQLGR